jgi:transcriptional regulator with XRE-family HTH domain
MLDVADRPEDLMGQSKQPFGAALREMRVAKGYSLRKFAEMVDLSPTYISLVEQGKVESPPTLERLRKMAEVLEQDPDGLITLAGRVPQDLSDIIKRKPASMPALLRAAGGLTAADLRRLVEEAERLKRAKGRGS